MTKDWINENAYRAFPFEENSSPECVDGTSLPDWLFRDVKAVVVPWNMSRDIPEHVLTLLSFEIRRTEAKIYRITAWFGVSYYDMSGLPKTTRRKVECMTSLVNPAFVADGSLAGWDDETLGPCESFFKVVFGSPVSLDDDSLKDGFFDVEHVLKNPRPILQTRCIYRPGWFGVSGFWTDSDRSTPHGIRKYVLKDGHNTTLRIRGGKIILGVEDGAGLGHECPVEYTTEIGMRMINGQHADSDGTFSFVAGDGISISSGTYDSEVLGELPAVIVSLDKNVVQSGA